MRNNRNDNLKLGKGAPFVKSKIRRLPQTDDAWEAGFQALPKHCRGACNWLGMVLSLTDDFLLADEFLELTPNVNDLARLLANAMRRPLIEQPHRPKIIHLTASAEWNELIPHLRELGIEVEAHAELSHLEKETAGYLAEFSAVGP